MVSISKEIPARVEWIKFMWIKTKKYTCVLTVRPCGRRPVCCYFEATIGLRIYFIFRIRTSRLFYSVLAVQNVTCYGRIFSSFFFRRKIDYHESSLPYALTFRFHLLFHPASTSFQFFCLSGKQLKKVKRFSERFKPENRSENFKTVECLEVFMFEEKKTFECFSEKKPFECISRAQLSHVPRGSRIRARVSLCSLFDSRPFVLVNVIPNFNSYLSCELWIFLTCEYRMRLC